MLKPSFSFLILAMICLAMICLSCAYAQVDEGFLDYGVKGHLFDIEEESIIEEIIGKLKEAEAEGKLEKLNAEFSEKVKAKVLRPNPVEGIKKATASRSRTYDPTYTQETDAIDNKGRIIVAAGTSINPLDKLKWGEPLIFIDGDDKEQINWARKQAGKIVLVKGAPLEVADLLKRRVFFDQAGIFCNRFKIEAVPALIYQEENHLRIEEFKL